MFALVASDYADSDNAEANGFVDWQQAFDIRLPSGRIAAWIGLSVKTGWHLHWYLPRNQAVKFWKENRHLFNEDIQTVSWEPQD